MLSSKSTDTVMVGVTTAGGAIITDGDEGTTMVGAITVGNFSHLNPNRPMPIGLARSCMLKDVSERAANIALKGSLLKA
jgi:hypothetical protein